MVGRDAACGKDAACGRDAACGKDAACCVPTIGLLLLIVGSLYLRTLAPGITWANDGADGGDLIAAAATGGVAHPTGYPSYLLLVRLFLYIPIGDLAYRANLFSLLCALLALVAVYRVIRTCIARTDWLALFAAAIATLSLALSPVFWSQAVITEVHSLNALWVAVVSGFLLHTLAAQSPLEPWSIRLQALCVGLALGNHVTLAALTLVWAVAVAVRVLHAGQPWLIGQQMLWLCAGLLVYLYLPLSAAADPAINWGDPVTWSGFWWVVSAAPYRDLAFGLPPEFLGNRVASWAGLLMGQAGWMGVLLGFGGLLYGSPRSQTFVWLTAVLGGIYSIFAITYDTHDSYAYLLPVFIFFAIWIGLGIDAVLRAGIRHFPNIAIAPGLAGLLALMLLWPVPATLQRVDASQDNRAILYATSVLAQAPPQALVLTATDVDTFPLWYYHYALGQRPDLLVITQPLLQFAWYRNHMRTLYPALHIPEQPGADWTETLRAANPTLGSICTTRVELDNPGNSQVLECHPAGVGEETGDDRR